MTTKREADLRDLVQQLAAVLDMYDIPLHAELKVKVSDILHGRVAGKTDRASKQRGEIGRTKRQRIMFAAVKHRLANADNPGSVTKDAAADLIADEVGTNRGDVLVLLSRLWPGREWTHPNRAQPAGSGELLAPLFDDDGQWMFLIDQPLKRSSGAG